jgi:hypothetical protein
VLRQRRHNSGDRSAVELAAACMCSRVRTPA